MAQPPFTRLRPSTMPPIAFGDRTSSTAPPVTRTSGSWEIRHNRCADETGARAGSPGTSIATGFKGDYASGITTGCLGTGRLRGAPRGVATGTCTDQAGPADCHRYLQIGR